MKSEPMNFSDIRRIIEVSIRTLLANDSYLLKNNVNEQAITHKLGEILQNNLRPYNIDCEYNRMVNAAGNVVKKTINIANLETLTRAWKRLTKARPAREEQTEIDRLPPVNPLIGETAIDAYDRVAYFLQEYGSEQKRVLPIFPDIICHSRGKMSNNSFVIEAKKSKNCDLEAINFDIVKLLAMTHQLRYRFGFYLELPIGKDFSDGAQEISIQRLYENEQIYIISVSTDGRRAT